LPFAFAEHHTFPSSAYFTWHFSISSALIALDLESFLEQDSFLFFFVFVLFS
jgi:hypothetical protein